MVGRLVEQQHVRVAEQRLRQQHLDLVVAVQLRHFEGVLVLGHAQLVEHGLRAGFRIPAVHLGKFALQLRRANAVLIGKVGLGIERFLLLHHIVEAFIAHNDGGDHVVVVIEEVILLQHREALAGA